MHMLMLRNKWNNNILTGVLAIKQHLWRRRWCDETLLNFAGPIFFVHFWGYFTNKKNIGSYTATVQKGAWAKVHRSSVLVALILIENTFPYKSNKQTQVNLHPWMHQCGWMVIEFNFFSLGFCPHSITLFPWLAQLVYLLMNFLTFFFKKKWYFQKLTYLLTSFLALPTK